MQYVPTPMVATAVSVNADLTVTAGTTVQKRATRRASMAIVANFRIINVSVSSAGPGPIAALIVAVTITRPVLMGPVSAISVKTGPKVNTVTSANQGATELPPLNRAAGNATATVTEM